MARAAASVQHRCANLGRVPTAVTVLLVALLCLAVGAIAALVTQLKAAQREIGELRQALEADPGRRAVPGQPRQCRPPGWP